jgi:hypothetical protein
VEEHDSLSRPRLELNTPRVWKRYLCGSLLGVGGDLSWRDDETGKLLCAVYRSDLKKIIVACFMVLHSAGEAPICMVTYKNQPKKDLCVTPLYRQTITGLCMLWFQSVLIMWVRGYPNLSPFSWECLFRRDFYRPPPISILRDMTGLGTKPLVNNNTRKRSTTESKENDRGNKL